MSRPTSFRFQPQTLELLDRLAAKLRRSRTATLIFLIEQGSSALLDNPSNSSRAPFTTEPHRDNERPRIPDEVVSQLVDIVLQAAEAAEAHKSEFTRTPKLRRSGR